jgi:hypothetical protein
MKFRTTAQATVLVAAGFVLGSLGGRSARTAPPAGGGAYEVARRLCVRGLCLRVVPAAAENVYAGAYLTSTDRTWGELVCLPFSAAAAARWRGTVLCKEEPPGMDCMERDPQRLLRHGNLFFYGDPELLRQVAEVLRR